MLAINTIFTPQQCRQVPLLRLTGLPLFLLSISLVGCSKPNPASIDSATAPKKLAVQPARIYAQGQIMPAQGIIRLFTTPGDVVTALPAVVGAKVKRGDELAVMRSEKSIQSQNTTLMVQKENAVRERNNAVRQAELKLLAAEMKLQQVQSQQFALDRQASLLQDAERQVASSEDLVQRLTNIASDSLTREFVSQLEIDRQRLSVNEARSKVAQQRLTRDQANLDLQLASSAAQAELDAAKTLLAMAKEASPERAFDSQMEALQAEAGRAVLVAPVDGVILAVNTSVGGSVVQSPLIELANLDSIVCELEVNVSQARWIEIGQKVTIRSDSLAEELSGTVKEKSQVVGKPRLRSLDPLAAVDYRTLSVIVALDKPELASQWLQLQIEGQIDINTASRP